MRKKIVSYLLMVCMLMGTFSLEVFGATLQGAGTAALPYLIYTAEDLFSIPANSTSYYKVMNDLDLKTVNRAPISNFKGKFDGNNKVIRNLRVVTTSSQTGLFSILNGELKNISLENVYIQANSHAGGLVGETYTGSYIYNCHVVNANVTNTYGSAGGLVGYASGGVVSNCSVTEPVCKGAWDAAGLIGSLHAEINNSYVINYSSGDGKTGNLGALVGGIDSISGKITNCYTTSKSAIISNCLSTSTSYNVTSSYFDKTLANSTNGVTYARTTAEMYKKSTYVGWDFNNIWAIDEGKGYPYLRIKAVPGATEASPYLIYTAEDLFSIPANSYSHYKVMNDLDLKNIDRFPIVNFKGIFDGNNKIIKNLKIVTTSNSAALFDSLYGELKNIILENVEAKGVAGGWAGGLAATSLAGSSIYNCHLANINLNFTSSTVGGLVGYAQGGVISNCSVIEISGNGTSNAGGLVGSLHGEINNSYVINSTQSGSGILGALVGGIGGTGKTTNCYSTSKSNIISNYLRTGTVGTVTSSYFDKTLLNNTTDGAAFARTTAEMYKQSTYIGWDFNNTWVIEEGKGYPYLRSYKNTNEPQPEEPLEPITELKAPEFSLSWNSVEYATGYEVSINGDIVSTTNTSIKVKDLDENIKNTVLVRAINDTLKSPWSRKLIISLDDKITEPPIEPIDKTPINEKDENVNIFALGYRESEQASDVWYNSEDCDASKALDGDLSTRWATMDNNYDPAVLTVNLKDVMVFNEIFISEVSVRTAQYTLEYLDLDTNKWVIFHTGNKIGGSATVDGFGEVITKSIRITCHREVDEPGGVSLYEFQAKYK